MMRLILPFLILLFSCSNLIAQSGYTRSDSSAIFALIDKAELFFTDENYDSALFYCNKAENLSIQKKFKKGQAYALIEATDVYIDKDDLDYTPFDAKGGLMKMWNLFGEEMDKIINELNSELVA